MFFVQTSGHFIVIKHTRGEARDLSKLCPPLTPPYHGVIPVSVSICGVTSRGPVGFLHLMRMMHQLNAIRGSRPVDCHRQKDKPQTKLPFLMRAVKLVHAVNNNATVSTEVEVV